MDQQVMTRRPKADAIPLRGVTVPADAAENFETQIREVVQNAKSTETPAIGRAASAAISGAVEHVADEVRTKIKDLVEELRQIEAEGEEVIAELSKRGLALQDRIESFARLTLAARVAIRDAGGEERRP
jgi:hypothetical protein